MQHDEQDARSLPAPAAAAVAGLAPLAEPPPPDRNPAAVYLRSLTTESGRAGMRSHLRTVVRIAGGGAGDDVARFPWSQLRFQHVAAIRAALVESGAAPATCNAKLAAVRGVLRAAWRLGQVSTDEYRRAADVGGVKGSRLPAGRALEMREIAALFAACADGQPAGARDAALLAILYGAGLRVAEGVALQTADVAAEEDDLALRVVGKGNRERQVHCTNGGSTAIRTWLDVRGGEAGPVLCRVSQAGVISPLEGLTPTAVRMRLVRRCRQAGIAAASPHDLRRTFVSQLLEASGDFASVQRLAGHAHVATTIRYDRRGDRAARRTAAMLHVPYQGRGGSGKLKLEDGEAAC